LYDCFPHFFAGNPHKPTLSVQPGLVVAKGKQVTISCEVTTGAREYRLYKEGGPHPWRTRNTPKTTNKAQFLIPSIEQRSGGIYRCYYKTPTGWSEHSDPLELAVTGERTLSPKLSTSGKGSTFKSVLSHSSTLEGNAAWIVPLNTLQLSLLGLYSKPSLSTQPSNVVNSGETVTLQCVSTLGFNRFVLTKEGEQKWSLIQESEFINSTGQFQGLFTVGPVTPSQRWIFRCYGYHVNSPQVWSEPSDLLEIHVSGEKAPTLTQLVVDSISSLPRILLFLRESQEVRG
jgi:leukocyte immunoglobulin-like receptor